MSKEQNVLFPESTNDPYNEWQDMPEFVQERQEPYAKITIRCATQQDFEDLQRRLEQEIPNTRASIWHPKLERGKYTNYRWVNES